MCTSCSMGQILFYFLLTIYLFISVSSECFLTISPEMEGDADVEREKQGTQKSSSLSI